MLFLRVFFYNPLLTQFFSEFLPPCHIISYSALICYVICLFQRFTDLMSHFRSLLNYRWLFLCSQAHDFVRQNVVCLLSAQSSSTMIDLSSSIDWFFPFQTHSKKIPTLQWGQNTRKRYHYQYEGLPCTEHYCCEVIHVPCKRLEKTSNYRSCNKVMRINRYVTNLEVLPHMIAKFVMT